MGWVRGVGGGGGVGWVWRCVSGVRIVQGKLWMYPHSATPRIPTQSQYNTKSSQPTAYARLARPHFHHLAQTHTYHTYPTSIPPNSTPESILLQPTRPDPRPYQKRSVHYPTNRHTLPPPNQTHSHTSTRPNYPTISTPYIIVPSKLSPLLPLLSSVLARRTCH